MQNRIKEHLPPKVDTIDDVHEAYKESKRGCAYCNFPLLAPDDCGDLTCQHCYAISKERWTSGGDDLWVAEGLIAVKEDNINDWREIDKAEDAYPNEVASQLIFLRMPSSNVPGKHGIYPYNPTLVNLN